MSRLAICVVFLVAYCGKVNSAIIELDFKLEVEQKQISGDFFKGFNGYQEVFGYAPSTIRSTIKANLNSLAESTYSSIDYDIDPGLRYVSTASYFSCCDLGMELQNNSFISSILNYELPAREREINSLNATHSEVLFDQINPLTDDMFEIFSSFSSYSRQIGQSTIRGNYNDGNYTETYEYFSLNGYLSKYETIDEVISVDPEPRNIDKVLEQLSKGASFFIGGTRSELTLYYENDEVVFGSHSNLSTFDLSGSASLVETRAVESSISVNTPNVFFILAIFCFAYFYSRRNEFKLN